MLFKGLNRNGFRLFIRIGHSADSNDSLYILSLSLSIPGSFNGVDFLQWKTIASSMRCCGDPITDIDIENEAEAWSSSRAKMRDQVLVCNLFFNPIPPEYRHISIEALIVVKRGSFCYHVRSRVCLCVLYT